ncbi:MAG TPA: MFS transporter [Bacteroidales bacterium]|nr:MFS transporter [Bacteroidales bacterium]
MTKREPGIPEDKSLQKSVLLVATFASFLNPFLGSAINLALPAIEKDLNTNAVELGWIASSFILTSAIFLLPMGKLADIRGRIKIFRAGIFLFTLSTFFIIFCRDFHSLIIMRIFQGLSGAMFFGTSLAIITSVFPPGERGKAMGINITAVYLGLSAGPIIGGFLTKEFGWRSIFIFLVPIGIIAQILISRKIKTDWAEASGEKFDWKGSILYGISLALFMYGFSKLPSFCSWICLSSGILVGIVFILFEKSVNYPVFDIKLFLHNRVLTFSGIAALIHYAATSAIGFFMSLYLQYIQNLDARSAGFIMIAQPLAMMILSPAAGKLSDRKNPGVIASIGMAITAISLVSLCFLRDNTPLFLIIILLGITGTGFAFFSSPNSNAIMSSVEKKYLGVASATVGTMRMIGQMTSMGIAMMLLALFIGKQQILPSTYKGLMAGMRTGFMIFSVLSIIGIFASLARNKSLNRKS